MALFKLPDLPYAYDALEPYIDSTTMQIHHSKHHNTYVNNINKVIGSPEGEVVKGHCIATVCKNVKTYSDSIRTKVINSGGGHFNHSMFWSIMGKVGSCNSAPVGTVKSKIEECFGSFDEMKSSFNLAAASRFGSGWAWLSVDADGKLFISSTANQENPLMEGVVEKQGNPILGLDVWEHAYYLKYQNRRPEYISAFWSVVNWDAVSANYESVSSGGTAVFKAPIA